VPDEEKCEAFFRAQKTVVEEIATKALAPTGNFWNPSRLWRRSTYRVLSEGKTVTKEL